jgi:type II secretory pathway pseudopilin PulG
MPVDLRRNEEGFTMIITVIGISLIALLVLVAVTAVNGDAQLTTRDSARKQAYEAAKAGIEEYAYHLHANTAYWAECTEPAGTTKEPLGTKNALNQEGSTSNRRPVPGSTNTEYAIELVPANGYKKCEKGNLSSMLQAGNVMTGTFRIRSNGYAGPSHVAITATFKPASFLDYVYFTQYETSDPVTYGIPELIKAAERQCVKWIREGRYTAPLKNEKGETLNKNGEIYSSGNGEPKYCDTISFVGKDNIKGPMHTNDAFVICEEPTLGRNVNDSIEVSSPPKGWYVSNESSLNNPSNCKGGSNKRFLGTFRTNAPVIVPPASNSELETIAEAGYRFEGEVSICLEGSYMKVNSGRVLMNESHECPSTGTRMPLPSNGVIYVKSIACTGAYSPFNLTYSSTASQCGNVNVSGTYAKPLTIAAANDLIITENLTKSSESAMLGLIANNFIRIYHPVNLKTEEKCETVQGVTTCHPVTTCLSNAAGSLSNLKIEAAMLALMHSIIVDNYNCGAQLGNLNVVGALAQKFRGAVGTSNSTGYLKNYEYDNRLKLTEPPSFLQPVKSDWVIGTETTE